MLTTDNAIVIDAPFDVVWTMTNDVASWTELFTEYAAVEILEERPDTVRFRLTTVPDPDGSVWSWVSERTSDPATRSVRASRVETGPFAFMTITWNYDETAEGVRMRWRQEFEMKPGFRFTDEQMLARLNGTSQEQMQHIRSVVERSARTAGAGVQE